MWLSKRRRNTGNFNPRLFRAMLKKALYTENFPAWVEEEFLDTLGYSSDRKESESVSPCEFLGQVKTSDDRYLVDEVKTIRTIFNFTNDEVRDTLGTQEYERIGWGKKIGNADSFIFSAVDLKKTYYSPRDLSRMLKRINRVYTGILCAVIFRYTEWLAVALVGRRPSLRNDDKDVQYSVSTVRHIPLDSRLDKYNPYMLHKLSLGECLAWIEDSKVAQYNFDGLMKAWISTLSYKRSQKGFLRNLKDRESWHSD